MIPEINIENLDGYESRAWSQNFYFETTDKKYSFWFYNVEEQTMMAYYGHLSIFDESAPDLPILSSGKIWIWYDGNDTFVYAQESDCLIFRMPVIKNEINKSDYPYLLIKPSTRCFSLIEWDFTSIYYSLDEIGKNVVEVRELNAKELDRVNFPRRTGEKFKFDNLIWHDLKEFERAWEFYLAK